MKCPCCPDATLSMMDRQGVEIDFCPQCRGIWLDRGELDKLLALAASAPAAGSRDADRSSSARHDDDDDRRNGERYKDDDRHERGDRRKKSWLNDIFN